MDGSVFGNKAYRSLSPEPRFSVRDSAGFLQTFPWTHLIKCVLNKEATSIILFLSSDIVKITGKFLEEIDAEFTKERLNLVEPGTPETSSLGTSQVDRIVISTAP